MPYFFMALFRLFDSRDIPRIRPPSQELQLLAKATTDISFFVLDIRRLFQMIARQVEMLHRVQISRSAPRGMRWIVQLPIPQLDPLIQQRVDRWRAKWFPHFSLSAVGTSQQSCQRSFHVSPRQSSVRSRPRQSSVLIICSLPPTPTSDK